MELRTSVEKPNSDDTLAFFMPTLMSNERKLVGWQNIEEIVLDKLGISEANVGQDINDILAPIGKRIDLVIQESNLPNYWRDHETGEVMIQEPKINPTTKEVILIDGRVIFQNIGIKLVLMNAPESVHRAIEGTRTKISRDEWDANLRQPYVELATANLMEAEAKAEAIKA